MSLQPGTKLGNYEIRSQIGAGGMGEVYLAHDSRLKRDVAIKVLPEQFARDPERLARFRREAQLLASLNHPNIAAIYGIEDSGRQPCLVMEYVPGETLQDRVRREGPVPLEEALEITQQICEALEHAHEKTVIHRHLKPANVKLTPEGQVKVLDFGLAKAFAADSAGSGEPYRPLDSNAPTVIPDASPTLPGVILGTAAYMSPEQARGKQVDKRTDIWALGCVLYELLTGHGAFHGLNQSRARPMVCFVNIQSVDRIVSSIWNRFNPQWKTRTLQLLTQAA
ncbi:MAG: serine/threonine protein kinase [Acidobacteria bacterium]|nr:serine/threonine protein kinase [Acidobacteriota bacterium]